MLYQESETVELKESYTEEIGKEIIAFANTNGGTIYVGVKDNGEITGLDDYDSVMLQISSNTRDAIKPDVTMFIRYNVLNVEDKNILEIKVQRGTARPYYLGSKGLKPRGVFVRQGTSSAPASEEYIRRMIKETDGDEFESTRSLNQDLTFDVAKEIFASRNIEFTNIQMRTLGLINDEGIYTNIALLLSDQCPHIIKVATFKGTSQDEFQDRKEFTGSVLKQLSDAFDYLTMRNQTKATFKGLYRTDNKDYDDVAIREALLNAIVHRDYSNLAGNIISLYQDRIEFISYGGLAGGITLEDALMGLSVCRNIKLANVFYRLNLIEAYGTGLQKILNSYANKNCSPKFLVGTNAFKVILPNCNSFKDKKTEDELDTETKKIIKYIRSNELCQRSDIQEYTGLSASTTVRYLTKLRNMNIVILVGKGKNTKYILNKNLQC